ncbi:hypothetical protein P171DRAFT_439818 [Karstenula rhodostoma CBS 690.94]|uniref:Ankyrin n=1 Tax=Karstenula rhodostoma CBS 690.94 TaxID=1392251 RepID=A0A9P4PS93_9PLEO|nr:hypothetical protein P171DRAFT_439818 [Karstenula rhodostoma CBS 690.94]
MEPSLNYDDPLQSPHKVTELHAGMQLLYLPVELFQRIVHELVSSCRGKKEVLVCLEQRSVCHMDTECMDACTEALCSIAVYYGYPNRKYLGTLLGIPTNLDHVFVSRAVSSWAKITTEMELAAAAAMGDAKLVADLLPRADFREYGQFAPFGEPYNNAALRGQDQVIKVILDYINPEVNFTNGSWKVGNYEAIAKHNANGRYNWRQLLRCGNEKYLKFLIELHQKWSTIRDPWVYQYWLAQAINSDNAQMVTVLLDIGIKTMTKPSSWIPWTQDDSEWALKEIFDSACFLNRTRAVDAYIHHPDLGPNYLLYNYITPLSIAAECDRKSVVETLLQAGACPSGVEGCPSDPITRAAIHQRWDNVDLLISHGADTAQVERMGLIKPGQTGGTLGSSQSSGEQSDEGEDDGTNSVKGRGRR